LGELLNLLYRLSARLIEAFADRHLCGSGLPSTLGERFISYSPLLLIERVILIF